MQCRKIPELYLNRLDALVCVCALVSVSVSVCVCVCARVLWMHDGIAAGVTVSVCYMRVSHIQCITVIGPFPRAGEIVAN